MPKDSMEKVKAFEQVVLMMDLVIPQLTAPKHLDLSQVFKQLRALSLRQQGACLHNLLCPLKKMSEPEISLFLDATKMIRRSCTLYQEIQDQKGYKTALEFLDECLHKSSSACAVYADSDEISDDSSLDYFTEAAKNILESIKIKSTQEKKKHQFATLAIAVHKVLKMYFKTNSHFLELSASPQNTMGHYKALIDNSNFTKKLINFISIYLLDSQLDFQPVSTKVQEKDPTTPHRKKQVGRKGEAYTSPTFKNVAPILGPDEFIKLPWTTYCGALNAATLACRSLAEQQKDPQMSGLFLAKAQAHAEDASNAFKEHIYQGEYEGTPELEKAFIHGQLADLLGNSTPLTQFYQTLRKIRKEQKHQQSVQRMKAEIARLKLEKAQREAEEQRRQKQREESAQRKVSPLSLLDEPVPSDTYTNAHPSPELPKKKEKIKTRGTANPKYLETPSEKEESPEEEIPEKISLNSTNHHIFHSLTGKFFDRKISLDDVLKLLPSLGCEIRDAKGSHRVATAPNGQIWTIPGPWDPPIPHYYRLQLNDFLQNKLEIDPADVVIG